MDTQRRQEGRGGGETTKAKGLCSQLLPDSDIGNSPFSLPPSSYSFPPGDACVKDRPHVFLDNRTTSVSVYFHSRRQERGRSRHIPPMS